MNRDFEMAIQDYVLKVVEEFVAMTERVPNGVRWKSAGIAGIYTGGIISLYGGLIDAGLCNQVLLELPNELAEDLRTQAGGAALAFVKLAELLREKDAQLFSQVDLLSVVKKHMAVYILSR